VGADLRVGGHHEPFVVVEPVVDELDPRAVVPEEVVPVEVVPEEVVPEEVVDDVVPEEAVVLGVVAEAATTVPLWLAAKASARCRPRPPTASVEARSAPAVQRRVVESARFVRRVVIGAPGRRGGSVWFGRCW
jgi:hypothetical protein